MPVVPICSGTLPWVMSRNDRAGWIHYGTGYLACSTVSSCVCDGQLWRNYWLPLGVEIVMLRYFIPPVWSPWM